MNWLHYLLQVNLYLVLFYAFYRIALNEETFFNLNRAYLIAAAAFSFFIPLMQSEWIRGWFVSSKVHETLYEVYNPQIIYQRSESLPSFYVSWGELLAFIYITGVLIGIAKFSLNVAYLGKLMRGKLIGEQSERAFSFFNFLFVSQDMKGRNTVLEHEKVHIRQLHSADVLLFELITIFNWFNPVTFFYKRSIKCIHEYIADDIASRHENTRNDYAMLLFSQQFGVQTVPLTNDFFNESLLKQRIKMLMKDRSEERSLLKYGFIAPLFLLMIVLSSSTMGSRQISKMERNIGKMTGYRIEVLPSETVKPASKVLAESGVHLTRGMMISADLAEELVNEENNRRQGIYDAVDNQAEFPGGRRAFSEFLQENIEYPSEAIRAKTGGKVYIAFVVNTDGSTQDFKVIKGLGYGLEQEALRVLKLIPRWIPGIQKGKVVRSKFVVPINFVPART
ncbi:TonB family C-terminal domain-containing protein [Pseudarcicella hirudinis]|uniref:TonB family C-terminal domain-containing protein n=1 Tax=Pseudarcicella hirudinis TaxID=1079859 RepID=A0A1I5YFX8_9BACT|nr:M56 family metallopeptidase [Pseudarcicella hirudinis]SFQ43030.1 TonB family C-terminal domain-containing protein [Pseudarcicella hirudinis]